MVWSVGEPTVEKNIKTRPESTKDVADSMCGDNCNEKRSNHLSAVLKTISKTKNLTIIAREQACEAMQQESSSPRDK